MVGDKIMPRSRGMTKRLLSSLALALLVGSTSCRVMPTPDEAPRSTPPFTPSVALDPELDVFLETLGDLLQENEVRPGSFAVDVRSLEFSDFRDALGRRLDEARQNGDQAAVDTLRKVVEALEGMEVYQAEGQHPYGSWVATAVCAKLSRRWSDGCREVHANCVSQTTTSSSDCHRTLRECSDLSTTATSGCHLGGMLFEMLLHQTFDDP